MEMSSVGNKMLCMMIELWRKYIPATSLDVKKTAVSEIKVFSSRLYYKQ